MRLQNVFRLHNYDTLSAASIIKTLILSTLLWLGSITQAQLSWDTTEVYLEQNAGMVALEATFSFENTGKYPLYIKRVCSQGPDVRARLQGGSKTVRPGESRSIVLRAPNRLLFKEIEFNAQVVTDERHNAKTSLTFHAAPAGWSGMNTGEREALRVRGEALGSMPLPVEVSPRSVLWTIDTGEKVDGENVIDVKFAADQEAELIGLKLLRGEADWFDANIENIEDGRHYQIRILPRYGADRLAARTSSLNPRSMHVAWLLETTLADDAEQRAVLDGPLVIRAIIRTPNEGN